MCYGSVSMVACCVFHCFDLVCAAAPRVSQHDSSSWSHRAEKDLFTNVVYLFVQVVGVLLG